MMPPRAYFDVCREVAEKIAGRPVAVARCAAWRSPGLPEEFWSALDGSPLESMSAMRSSSEVSLRGLIERRLGKEWDQVQVKTDLEAIGFVCGARSDGGPGSREITTATPKFGCAGAVGEIAEAPSQARLQLNIQILVTLTFSESGEPRGWREIKVKAGGFAIFGAGPE
jgi:hypothetical protein